MKHSNMFFVFLLLISSIMLFTVFDDCFAQDKVITLRYSDHTNVGDPLYDIVDQWCREVEKRTDGRIKVRHYPVGSLNSPMQMYESITQGVVDIGNHLLGYTQGRFPQMVLAYDCPWEYSDAHTSTKVATEFNLKFRPREFDGVKVMYFHSTASAILFARKPVNGLEDLRGMKIRTQGPNARIMSQFGVIPVGMPVMEVYDALSKGMVDGITTTYAAMKMWSLGDLIKYAIEYRGSSFVALAVVAMNKDKWNAIPPDLQKIIEDINKEWVKKHTNVQEMAEKVGKDYVISKGVQVSRLSSEENAKWTVKANVLFDEYVANMKQKNLPGDEAVRFVRDIVKNAR